MDWQKSAIAVTGYFGVPYPVMGGMFSLLFDRLPSSGQGTWLVGSVLLLAIAFPAASFLIRDRYDHTYRERVEVAFVLLYFVGLLVLFTHLKPTFQALSVA